MLQRIKQFVNGVNAKPLTAAEEKFLHKALQEPAIEYFKAMTVGDQRHTFNVLYTALHIYESENYDSGCAKPRFHIKDKGFMVRCVLMHDIGRGPNMGVMDKTLAVLVNATYPDYAKAKAAPSAEKRWELMYRYYYHGEIGADILRKIGMQEEADVIQFHHYYGDEQNNSIYDTDGNDERILNRFSMLTYNNLSSEKRQILKLLQEADSQN